MSKNFIIAGGTSGIGLEIVKKLSAEGHRVTCACRTPDSLPRIEGVESVEFDATKEANFDCPNQVDGVVYCPGTINLKPFHRFSDDEFRNDFDVNALGAVRLLRHILPALKKANSASVVLFSTVAVQTGLPFLVLVEKDWLQGLEGMYH